MGTGTSSGRAKAGAVFIPKYSNLGPLARMRTAGGAIKVGTKATVVRDDGEVVAFTAVDGRGKNMANPVAWRDDGTNTYIDGSSFSLVNYFRRGVQSVRLKKSK